MTARRPIGDDSCDPAAAAERESGERDQAPSRGERPAIDATPAKPCGRARSHRKKPPGLY